MLTLVLPSDIAHQIVHALTHAGRREIGGLLMAEHVGINRFVVRDITIGRRGTFASFFRRIQNVRSRLTRFFNRTRHDYTRFNYIGEWHSHPSFEPMPSGVDHRSMLDIITDESIGGNFAVLMVVKLNSENTLAGTVHTYCSDGRTARSELLIEHLNSEQHG